jgi:hypothetical protein
VDFTTTGSFGVLGVVINLAPGTVPIVRFPVVNAAGQFQGVREMVCRAPGADGRAVCQEFDSTPGLVPQLASAPGLGIVEVRILRPGGVPAPAAPAGPGGLAAVAAPRVLVVQPLLPPPPPVLLPPPALAPLPPPPLPPFSLEAALAPEVPVIPEADSLALLVGGLAALGALGGLRRWRRG